MEELAKILADIEKWTAVARMVLELIEKLFPGDDEAKEKLAKGVMEMIPKVV